MRENVELGVAAIVIWVLIIIVFAIDESKAKQTRLGGDVAPTVTLCGTTPTINGTDNSGVITIGTGVVTSCTLNFSRTYGAAPVCLSVGSSTTINVAITSISTTQLVLGLQASLPGGKLYYRCNAL